VSFLESGTAASGWRLSLALDSGIHAGMTESLSMQCVSEIVLNL
jgi:hypothetical protein